MLKNAQKNRGFHKSISSVLLFLFTFSSLGNADISSIAPVSSEVKLPSLASRIEIPETYGTVSGRFLSPQNTAGTIVHIQDAHASLDAQEHIRQTLHYLKQRYHFNLVLVEGGMGELQADKLQVFQEAPLNQELAELLLKRGVLSGSERFLLDEAENTKFSNRADNTKMYGVENLALYEKNLEAYRRVIAHKKESVKFLDSLQVLILTEGSRTLNPKLQKFFKEWAILQNRPDEIIRQLAILKKYASSELGLDFNNPLSQVQWPHLFRVYKLSDLETKMDLKTAPEELALLREWLHEHPSAGSGVEAVLGYSLEKGFPVKSENGTRSLLESFYASVKSSGFTFKNYPTLSQIWGRMILREEVDASQLFEEIPRLTDEILQKLAVSEKEKEIIRSYQDYLLLSKTLKLELTDWDYAQTLERRVVIRPSALVRKVQNSSEALSSRLSDSAFESALLFYQDAKIRDQVMFETMLSRMKTAREANAVIITGGFHSEGLQSRLKERGIAYVEIQPRISDLSQTTDYEKAMMLQGVPGEAPAFDKAQSENSSISFEKALTDPNASGPEVLFARTILDQSKLEVAARHRLSPDRFSGSRAEARHMTQDQARALVTPVGEWTLNERANRWEHEFQLNQPVLRAADILNAMHTLLWLRSFELRDRRRQFVNQDGRMLVDFTEPDDYSVELRRMKSVKLALASTDNTSPKLGSPDSVDASAFLGEIEAQGFSAQIHSRNIIRLSSPRGSVSTQSVLRVHEIADRFFLNPMSGGPEFKDDWFFYDRTGKVAEVLAPRQESRSKSEQLLYESQKAEILEALNIVMRDFGRRESLKELANSIRSNIKDEKWEAATASIQELLEVFGKAPWEYKEGNPLIDGFNGLLRKIDAISRAEARKEAVIFIQKEKDGNFLEGLLLANQRSLLEQGIDLSDSHWRNKIEVIGTRLGQSEKEIISGDLSIGLAQMAGDQKIKVRSISGRTGSSRPELQEFLRSTEDLVPRAEETPRIPKVLIADKLEKTDGIFALEAAGKIQILRKDQIGKGKDAAWLLETVQAEQPDVLLIRSDSQVNEEVLKALGGPGHLHAPIVLRVGADTNNVVTAKAQDLGVMVARTHGNQNSVANLDVRFLLTFLNKIYPESFRANSDFSQAPGIQEILNVDPAQFVTAVGESVKKKRGTLPEEQQTELFSPRTFSETPQTAFQDAKIALVGFGVIPQLIAEKMKQITAALGVSMPAMRAWTRKVEDPSLNAGTGTAEIDAAGLMPAAKQQLLKEANIISLHLPGSAKTFLDAAALEILAARVDGPIAIINTARLKNVDHEALLTALETKKDLYYYADIDLTTAVKDQPGTVKDIESLQALREKFPDRVFLVPHIAASTQNAGIQTEQNTLASLETIAGVFSGETPYAQAALDFVVPPRSEVHSLEAAIAEITEWKKQNVAIMGERAKDNPFRTNLLLAVKDIFEKHELFKLAPGDRLRYVDAAFDAKTFPKVHAAFHSILKRIQFDPNAVVGGLADLQYYQTGQILSEIEKDHTFNENRLIRAALNRTFDLWDREKRILELSHLVNEIDMEIEQPGSGNLPMIAAMQDLHGGSQRAASLTGFALGLDADVYDHLKDFQGKEVVEQLQLLLNQKGIDPAATPARFIGLNDKYDRGDDPVGVFELVKWLDDEHKAKPFLGNHDLWRMIAVLGMEHFFSQQQGFDFKAPGIEGEHLAHWAREAFKHTGWGDIELDQVNQRRFNNALTVINELLLSQGEEPLDPIDLMGLRANFEKELKQKKAHNAVVRTSIQAKDGKYSETEYLELPDIFDQTLSGLRRLIETYNTRINDINRSRGLDIPQIQIAEVNLDNFWMDPEIIDRALWELKNARLFHIDILGSLHNHNILPVDYTMGGFDVTYQGIKGMPALELLEEDLISFGENRKTLAAGSQAFRQQVWDKIGEALTIINAWYSDLNPVAKAPAIRTFVDKGGLATLGRGILGESTRLYSEREANFLVFWGHNEFKKFQDSKVNLPYIVLYPELGTGIVNIDYEMSRGYSDQGAIITIFKRDENGLITGFRRSGYRKKSNVVEDLTFDDTEGMSEEQLEFLRLLADGPSFLRWYREKALKQIRLDAARLSSEAELKTRPEKTAYFDSIVSLADEKLRTPPASAPGTHSSRAEARQKFVELAETARKNSWISESSLVNIKLWSAPEYRRIHPDLDAIFAAAGTSDEEWKKIDNAWYAKAAPGTAGIRGTRRLGANGINDYTLGLFHLAHALAVADPAYNAIIQKQDPEFNPSTEIKAVALGGDSRIGSYEPVETPDELLTGTQVEKPGRFMKLEALINVALGISVYMYRIPASTPQISWTVHHLDVSKQDPGVRIVSGSMSTASHNPSGDNGNKPYKPDGSQSTGDFASLLNNQLQRPDLLQRLDQLTYRTADGRELNVLDDIDAAFQAAIADGKIKWLGGDEDPYQADALFVQEELGEAIHVIDKMFNSKALDLKTAKIVISPLFGVSRHILERILKARGLRADQILWVQDIPDPKFPGIKGGKPNPETPEAREFALEVAAKNNADLILWTDPDSDRPAVAAKIDLSKQNPQPSDYISLNGNQQLAVLAFYLISQLHGSNLSQSDSALAKMAPQIKNQFQKVVSASTVVSGDLMKNILRNESMEVIETLTGFKYIGDQIENQAKVIQAKAGITERQWLALSKQKKMELALEHGKLFLMGGEESLGALTSDGPHDKDAIAGVMWFVEVLGMLRSQNVSMAQYLEEIYKTYGYFVEKFPMPVKGVKYGNVSLSEAEAMEVIKSDEGASILNYFRKTPPKTIAGKKVLAVLDYREQVARDAEGNVLFTADSHKGLITSRNFSTAKTSKATEAQKTFAQGLAKFPVPQNNRIASSLKHRLRGIYSFAHAQGEKLPSENFIKILLEDGSWIAVRPSGTEPVVKFYVNGRGLFENKAAVDQWINDAARELDQMGDSIARDRFPDRFRAEVRFAERLIVPGPEDRVSYQVTNLYDGETTTLKDILELIRKDLKIDGPSKSVALNGRELPALEIARAKVTHGDILTVQFINPPVGFKTEKPVMEEFLPSLMKKVETIHERFGLDIEGGFEYPNREFTNIVTKAFRDRLPSIIEIISSNLQHQAKSRTVPPGVSGFVMQELAAIVSELETAAPNWKTLPQAGSQWPQLRYAVQDIEALVAEIDHAVRTLNRAETRSPKQQIVASLLADPSTVNQAQAQNILGRVATADRNLIPDLQKLLQSQETWVRTLASEALRRIEVPGVPSVPVAVSAAKTPVVISFEQLTAQINAISLQSEGAFPVFDENAIQAIPEGNKTLIPALKRLLVHKDAAARLFALQALTRIGPAVVLNEDVRIQGNIHRLEADPTKAIAEAATIFLKSSTRAEARFLTPETEAVYQDVAEHTLPIIWNQAQIEAALKTLTDSEGQVTSLGQQRLKSVLDSNLAEYKSLTDPADAGKPVHLVLPVEVSTPVNNLKFLVAALADKGDTIHVLLQGPGVTAEQAEAYEAQLHQGITGLGLGDQVKQIRVIAAGSSQDFLRQSRRFVGDRSQDGDRGIADQDSSLLDEVGQVAGGLRLLIPDTIKEETVVALLAMAFLRDDAKEATPGVMSVKAWMEKKGINSDSLSERVRMAALAMEKISSAA